MHARAARVLGADVALCGNVRPCTCGVGAAVPRGATGRAQWRQLHRVARAQQRRARAPARPGHPLRATQSCLDAQPVVVRRAAAARPQQRRAYRAAGDELRVRQWTPPAPEAWMKALAVAVAGAPNAGKSALVNWLAHARVSAVSPKVNTTRMRVLGVRSDAPRPGSRNGHVATAGAAGDAATGTQLVFCDTPGLVSALDRSRYVEPLAAEVASALPAADVALLVVDGARRLDAETTDTMRRVAEEAAAAGVAACMVLNKLDLMRQNASRAPRGRPGARKPTRRERAQRLEERVQRFAAEWAHAAAAAGAEVVTAEDVTPAVLGARDGGMERDLDDDEGGDDASPFADVTRTLQALGRDRRVGPLDEPLTIIPPAPTARDARMEARRDAAAPLSGLVRGGGDGDAAVFAVSAMHSLGMHDLLAALRALAVPRPWEYPGDFQTDLSDVERVAELVREGLFRHLHKEVPYRVQQETRSWEADARGVLHIHQDVQVPSGRVAGMLLARGKAPLKAIRAAAEAELERALHAPVALHLHVAVKDARTLARRRR